MGYPDAKDELRMLRHMDPARRAAARAGAARDPGDAGARARVHVEDELLEYVVRLSQFTRQHRACYLGASPRAALALVQPRARALSSGRDFVLPDDIKALAVPVLAPPARAHPRGRAGRRGPRDHHRERARAGPHRWEAAR